VHANSPYCSYLFKYKCCGLDDYEDFKRAKQWENDYTIANITISLKAPIACCKMTGPFAIGFLTNATCLDTPDEYNSYIKQVNWLS